MNSKKSQASTRQGPPHTASAESELLGRLRAGDEAAFSALVDQLHTRLQAMARTIVRSNAVAEEAVQETWVAVIRGVHAFEGRSSLSTWVFSILVKRARTIAVREKRAEDLAGAGTPDGPWQPGTLDEFGESADLEPGMGPKGRWIQPPVPWGLIDPESEMLSREALSVVEEALENLPEAQRLTVRLCDVEELPPEDVCRVLEISESNRRVLLHRGRAGVRRALDQYMKEGTRAAGTHHSERQP